MSNRIIQKNNHSTSAITPQREQFLRKKIAHLKKTINGNGDLNTKPDQSYLHHNSLGLYGQKGSDDFTIRLKPTEAGFSPAQLKNIAQTASNYGQDALYLTSRQEVEIPLLPVEHTPDALEYLLSQRIDISGSTHNVFNIVNPEDAGTSLQEKFDTTPHVLALNRILNHSSNSSFVTLASALGLPVIIATIHWLATTTLALLPLPVKGKEGSGFLSEEYRGPNQLRDTCCQDSWKRPKFFMSLKPSNAYLLKTRKSSLKKPQTCDILLIIWEERRPLNFFLHTTQT